MSNLPTTTIIQDSSGAEVPQPGFAPFAPAEGAVSSFNGRSGAVTLQTADVTGVGTLSNNTTGSSSGLLTAAGETTGSNAAAGVVGEIITASANFGAAVTIPLTTPTSVLSISLTPGDWDLEGHANLNFAATPSQYIQGGFNTSVAVPNDGSECYAGSPLPSSAGYTSLVLSRKRYNAIVNTTVYLVVFLSSAALGWGNMSARRVR